MNKAPILHVSFALMLGLATASTVHSEESELWLPDEFGWDVSYSTVCQALYGTVYEMPPVEREKGTYTGVMGSRGQKGLLFTFCNDKLVGICVAYLSSHSRIPSISAADNEKGYTKTDESRSGNWIYIESGLKGYEVLNWEDHLGMRSALVTR